MFSLFEYWKFIRTKKVTDVYVYEVFELFACNAVRPMPWCHYVGLFLDYLLMPGARASRARCHSWHMLNISLRSLSGFVCHLLQGLRQSYQGWGGGVLVKSHSRTWLPCGCGLTLRVAIVGYVRNSKCIIYSTVFSWNLFYAILVKYINMRSWFWSIKS